MFGIDDALIGAFAGPLIGGLLGAGSSSSGGGQQQTATKEPWAEAAPWLKKQIKDGQALQDQYAANPFNAQQKTAYQNTFNDIDNYRNSIAPGIMDFANQTMTGPGYQRQRYDRPGQGGYGPQSQQPQQQPQPQQPSGLLQNRQGGPFSVAGAGLMNDGSRYAPIDFNAQKPPPQAAPPQVDPMDDFIRRMSEQKAQRSLTDYDSRGG